MNRRFLVAMVVAGLAEAVCFGLEVSWPGEIWEAAKPEDVGMDSEVLAKARDYALAGDGSGMITRYGRVVLRWGDQRVRYDLKSSTKAIGVTAVGLALKDGKFASMDDQARKYQPGLGIPPESNAQTGWIDKITLFHLATQTAGFDKPGGYTELLFEPGTKWSYSDGGSNWLAECVTLAYNRDLQELMFERVFGPIGIGRGDLSWRNNSYREHKINGIMRREFGSGIHANVDAMARIGYLYLRDGKWKDQQLIPAEFVEMVRRVPEKIKGLPVVKAEDYFNATDHYGLLWWNNADGAMKGVPPDAYWSWGLYDSLIVVMPSLDIVASRAGKSLNKQGNAAYSAIEPFIGAIASACRRRLNGGPYPASDIKIEWGAAETIVRQANGGDNWPITWADDDHLYTAYGDGWGFDPKVKEKLSLGICRIEGGPEDFRGVNVRSETGERAGQGSAGPKASGMLCVDGVLYMLVRNTGNSQIAWSADHGGTWEWSEWKFETSFGAPTFLNFGKDYAGARDGYVYIYSHDSDSAYEPADRMALARVPKTRIRDKEAYEFFVRHEKSSGAVWSKNISDRGAVFENRGKCYRSGISYNAGLKRYLWCQTVYGKEDMRFEGGLGIFEAGEPWGPWRTVFYTEKWDVGPGETSSFPSKWMESQIKEQKSKSKDTNQESKREYTAYLVFSGEDCFSVRKATFPD